MVTLNSYIKTLTTALDGVDRAAFDRVVAEVKRVYADDACMLVCGNGGSAATASHIVNDLVKGVAWDHVGKRVCRPMRVVGLTDCVPLMTAIANDTDYDQMFSGQVAALGREGDVLLAISGSGNSANVLRAVEAAKENGMTVIAFTGFDGGKLGPMADIHLHVPCNSMAHVEDVHLIIEHALVEILKVALRPAPASS